MLDSKPLGGDSRHIFHQTDLGIRFTGGLNADIAYFSVGQRNVVDQIPRIALLLLQTLSNSVMISWKRSFVRFSSFFSGIPSILKKFSVT